MLKQSCNVVYVAQDFVAFTLCIRSVRAHHLATGRTTLAATYLAGDRLTIRPRSDKACIFSLHRIFDRRRMP